jgi:hypothetical protein
VDAELTSPVPDRDFRIDLFRGLALWLIFIDHSPDNMLANITLKNFGFSDAAEIFVFLSGLASGRVYGAVARERGIVAASQRALRRGFQIYFAEILLFWLYVAEVSYLARWRAMFLHDANIAIFLAHPVRGFVEVMSLRYSPVNIDVLILMVILHLALPVVLPATIRHPRLTLVASALLYTTAHHLGWAIPAYPVGTLYFNPLTWQLLYVIGVWWGATQPKLQTGLNLSALTIVASAFLILSLVVALKWKIWGIDLVATTLGYRLYPIDKGSFDFIRFVHFLALAFVCYRIVPGNNAILRSRAARPLVQCGEHSLVIYCLGVLLAFATHAVLTLVSSTLSTQLLVTGIGIAAMSASAALLSRLDRSLETHPRTI